MKLLLYDMGAYTQNDIMDTLRDMHISYKNVLYKLKDLSEDAYFEKRIKELLEEEKFQAVFSVNYYPILARICKEFSIPYVSWSYDSPIEIKNLEETLGYETNYVFFFDRAECEKYQRKGYHNIYHLPLAVNTRRLDAIQIGEKDRQRYRAQISMVGQLYKSAMELYLMALQDYGKGYLVGAMEIQLKLYGRYILKEVITKEILEQIKTGFLRAGMKEFLFTKEMIALEMAKHVTGMERTLLLQVLSEEYQVNLYGPDKGENLEGVTWKGSAGYFDEMPKVFKLSDINLNVSLKCIQTGIPLRALDILGCQGFLLSNYQPELAEHFVHGEEVVMYTSLEDGVEKCQYYLEHEKERKDIAKRGYQKVKEAFRYEDRLRFMFQKAGLLL